MELLPRCKFVAGEPVSRILCGHASVKRAACSGDHSSRSRLAPRLQRPTRGLLSEMACAIAEGARSCGGRETATAER
jgi:hypothetical protein